VEPAGATTPTPSATAPTIAAMTGSTDLVMSGGPYPVTIRASNMNALGAMSLSITYNPAVLRAVVVNAGSFIQQGDVTPVFVPRIDNTQGRIDLSISRPAERPGATGTGDVAVIMFEPVAAGTSTITISGSAASVPGAGGTAQVITAQFVPANITVRRE
jgi:hypothetical protein